MYNLFSPGIFIVFSFLILSKVEFSCSSSRACQTSSTSKNESQIEVFQKSVPSLISFLSEIGIKNMCHISIQQND